MVRLWKNEGNGTWKMVNLSQIVPFSPISSVFLHISHNVCLAISHNSPFPPISPHFPPIPPHFATIFLFFPFSFTSASSWLIRLWPTPMPALRMCLAPACRLRLLWRSPQVAQGKQAALFGAKIELTPSQIDDTIKKAKDGFYTVRHGACTHEQLLDS